MITRVIVLLLQMAVVFRSFDPIAQSCVKTEPNEVEIVTPLAPTVAPTTIQTTTFQTTTAETTTVTTTAACPCAAGSLEALETPTGDGPTFGPGTATLDIQTDADNCQLSATIHCTVPSGFVPQLMFSNDAGQLNGGVPTVGPDNGEAIDTVTCDGNGMWQLTGDDDFTSFSCFYRKCPSLASEEINPDDAPVPFKPLQPGTITIATVPGPPAGQTASCSCVGTPFRTCQFALCTNTFQPTEGCVYARVISGDITPNTSPLITCDKDGDNIANGGKFDEIVCFSNDF